MNIKNKLYQKILNYRQKQINKKYARDGATDEIIENQIKVNRLRHKLNLPETVDGEYVQ